MKYRKRPIVVEAIHLTYESTPTPQDAAEWCGGKVIDNHQIGNKVHILIPTPEGEMRADYGDWIIKGVKGEFYPCKAEIFEATYDPVTGGGTCDKCLQQWAADGGPGGLPPDCEHWGTK